MNNTIHHADHQPQGNSHGLSKVEHKLIGLLLNGMGDPRLDLQLWDGSIITHHIDDAMATVYLESRPALWRFIFRPEIALSAEADKKGIHLEDANRFRQAMEDARKHLPGELLLVNRLLRIDAGKSRHGDGPQT